MGVGLGYKKIRLPKKTLKIHRDVRFHCRYRIESYGLPFYREPVRRGERHIVPYGVAEYAQGNILGFVTVYLERQSICPAVEHSYLIETQTGRESAGIRQRKERIELGIIQWTIAGCVLYVTLYDHICLPLGAYGGFAITEAYSIVPLDLEHLYILFDVRYSRRIANMKV